MGIYMGNLSKLCQSLKWKLHHYDISSLAAPKCVNFTTLGTVSDKNYIKMMIAFFVIIHFPVLWFFNLFPEMPFNCLACRTNPTAQGKLNLFWQSFLWIIYFVLKNGSQASSSVWICPAVPGGQMKPILTLNMQGPSNLGLTRSISWLLMPWLLASPEHQHPWYWLWRIDRFLSYLRMDFNCPCHTHGPLTRYVKLRVAHAPGMPGTFPPAAIFKGNR